MIDWEKFILMQIEQNPQFYIFKFRSCPHGYTCLGSIGGNPNFGFTSFDNLLWSMLTTFQLITLDYWENVYNMVSEQNIW